MTDDPIEDDLDDAEQEALQSIVEHGDKYVDKKRRRLESVGDDWMAKRRLRTCYAFPDRIRPCGQCPALRFGDGLFLFWAKDNGETADGTNTVIVRSKITSNTDLTTGSDPADRYDRLRYELPAEIEQAREAAMSQHQKFGSLRLFSELTAIGSREAQFARMLRIVRTGNLRRACACEVMLWINSHPDDTMNLVDQLHGTLRAFFEDIGDVDPKYGEH